MIIKLIPTNFKYSYECICKKEFGSIFLISLSYFFLALIFLYRESLFDYPLGVGDVVFSALPNLLTSNSFWDPYIVCGCPSVSDILRQTFYPLNKIFFVISKDIPTYNLYVFTHYTLAGTFTFIFLKSLRIKTLAAFSGGLIFMFSGFMMGHRNHLSVISVAVWLPFVLYCLEKYGQGRKMLFIILGSFGFCFSILAGYPQITLYLTIVVFAYLLFRGLDEKLDVRFIFGGFLMLAMGILLSAVQLIPLLELVRFTTRESISYGYFVSFSFDLKSLPLLMFPFYYGTDAPGFILKSYSGPWMLSELAGYMGILPLCLSAICLIMMWGNKQVLFWAFITISGFILVLGDTTPVYRFLYHVPVYNMFRVPARNWFEVNFAVAVLASFCMNHFLSNKEGLQTQVKRCTRTVAAVLVMITIGILLSRDFSGSTSPLSAFNGSMYYNLIGNLRSGATIVYIPLLIIIISLILLLLMPRFYFSKKYWVVIVIIVFFDLYSFGHFHANDYPHRNEIYTEKNSVFRFLKNRESSMDNFRIYPVEMEPKLIHPNTNKFYGLLTINGSSAVWLKNYVELTNSMPPNGQIYKPSVFLKNNYIMSVLAGKYIITKSDEIARVLDSIKTVRNQQKGVGAGTRVIIGKEDASKWWLGNAIFTDGIFTLQNPSETTLSSIAIPLKIKGKNKNYKMTLEAKGNLKDVLIAQIYAENYAPHSTWVGIETKDVSSDEFTNIERILDSEDCPEDGYVRLFTHSRSSVEIKNIVLEEIPDNRILWNKGETDKFYKKVHETEEGIKIYENLNYLPRIRFVKDVVPVGDFMETVNLLRYNLELNLKEEALVEGLPESSFEEGEISGVRFRDDRIDIRARTGDRAFLVLADTYFPGWKAYIDGKETKIYKTNGVTRGVLIEGKGEHDILFEYSPRGLKPGFLISISVCTILIGWFLSLKLKYRPSPQLGTR